MKIRFILLVVVSMVFAVVADAQCPQAFNYQAIVRNGVGDPVPSNTQVGVRFTIDDSINPGTPVYQETFRAVTNQFGLVTLHPGTGTPVSGTFSTINRASGHKYMMVEIDVNETGTYLNMGTEIQNSVPYALYADSAGKGGYPQHYIGQNYGGGIIFYVTDNGQHGLIADSADLHDTTDTITWANIDTTLLNASLSGTGGGYTNTERIVVNQGAGNYAANLCANDTTGGFGDWFLPSATELIILYQQQQVIGNFNSSATYWSSTENANTTASALNFSTGVSMSIPKATAGNVRAILAF
jgi:hypothetical protein